MPRLPGLVVHPTFGRNLVAWRVIRGFSLRSLEAASGISKSQLSNWERGLANPEYVPTVKLAETLRIPVAYLWDHLATLPDESPRKRTPKG